MPLNPDPAIFRAVVSTIVPESADLDEAGWSEVLGVVEALLRNRPAALHKQIRAFLAFIQWLPVIRFARPFTRLDAARRTRVLAHLQNDRVEKIRVGFWGLRTIVLAGYYGRPQAAADIGYRATPQGWEAAR